MKLLIGHATKHQLELMFQRFYPQVSLEKSRHFAELVLDRKKDVSLAQVQGHFMLYKSEPDQVLKNIDRLWT